MKTKPCPNQNCNQGYIPLGKPDENGYIDKLCPTCLGTGTVPDEETNLKDERATAKTADDASSLSTGSENLPSSTPLPKIQCWNCESSDVRINCSICHGAQWIPKHLRTQAPPVANLSGEATPSASVERKSLWQDEDDEPHGVACCCSQCIQARDTFDLAYHEAEKSLAPGLEKLNACRHYAAQAVATAAIASQQREIENLRGLLERIQNELNGVPQAKVALMWIERELTRITAAIERKKK